MSLAPLLAESLVVQLHAFVALALLLVTGMIAIAPKGRRVHRTLGWIWVLGMAIVAASSFAIHDLRQVGPFSWIHLLSTFTLVMLVLNVRAARRHNVAAHRSGMIWLTFGALGVAGAFTLMPGRVMFLVLSGG